MTQDRHSGCWLVSSVAAVTLLGLPVIMRRTDLATDGSQLAVPVLRASINVGRLDVTDVGWQYIVGLAVVAMVALAENIGVTHHSKVHHDPQPIVQVSQNAQPRRLTDLPSNAG